MLESFPHPEGIDAPPVLHVQGKVLDHELQGAQGGVVKRIINGGVDVEEDLTVVEGVYALSSSQYANCLSLFGWAVVSSESNTGATSDAVTPPFGEIQCSHCYRCLNIGHFISASSKKPFDPVMQHKYFCPWVFEQKFIDDRKERAGTGSKDSEGWKICRDSVNLQYVKDKGAVKLSGSEVLASISNVLNSSIV
jgi:hypothetical protein